MNTLNSVMLEGIVSTPVTEVSKEGELKTRSRFLLFSEGETRPDVFIAIQATGKLSAQCTRELKEDTPVRIVGSLCGHEIGEGIYIEAIHIEVRIGVQGPDA